MACGSFAAPLLLFVLAGFLADPVRAQSPRLLFGRSQNGLFMLLGPEVEINSWTVETSTDLLHWESLGDMVVHHAPHTYPEAQTMRESRRYYRALLHQENTQAGFSRNRHKWIATTPAAYHFTFRWQCFCLPEFVAPVDISVRNGQIVSVRRQEDGLELDESVFARYKTIDGLFDFLQEAIDFPSSSLSCVFDPCLGFPKRAFVDYSDAIADEERGFLIEHFEITPPAVQITDLEPSSLQLDQFSLISARIEGEHLFLSVRYGGGCTIHDFELFMSPAVFMESYPVQANLYLRHDSHGDRCRALIDRDLVFGLRPIIELYQGYYGGPAPIILNVFDYFQDSPQRRITARYEPPSLHH